MMSSWSPWRTTVKQISTCSLWRNLWRTDSGPCQSWMKLQPMETPHRNRFLTGDKACGEKPKLVQLFRKKLWDPYWSSLFLKVSKLYHMEEAQNEAVLKALQPMGRDVETFWEGLYPTGGTSHCSRVPVWGGKTNRYEALWTDFNPLSPGPWAPWREEVEKSGGKLNLERSELGESRWF